MVLLDSDVLIECLRGRAPAVAWLRSQADVAYGGPGVVAMELIAGARNRAESQETHNVLSTFNIIWPTSGDFVRAFELLSEFHLSHGIGIPDSLIAAMALRRDARLFTFNLKHFRQIPGLAALPPYPRR